MRQHRMRRHRRKVMLILLMGLWLGILAGTPCLYAARVFILHSYEQDHVCGQPQHDGVLAALRQAGYSEQENLVIETYYMDTKQRNYTPELIEHQAQLARKRIQAFSPQVLVTLDDNAFSAGGLGFFKAPFAVVFCGVNGSLQQYHARAPFMDARTCPGHNITGVFEKLHVSDALRVHSRLFSGVHTVLFLLDRSVTGQALKAQITDELALDPPPCAWRLEVVEGWEDYQEQVRRANHDEQVSAIYPAALQLKDARGKVRSAQEILPWTSRVSTKPELALNSTFTRLGLFGGAAVDFYAMGQQAGRMVVRILRGEDPARIAIEDASRYALAFNLKRARGLGLPLPQDVILSADEIVRD